MSILVRHDGSVEVSTEGELRLVLRVINGPNGPPDASPSAPLLAHHTIPQHPIADTGLLEQLPSTVTDRGRLMLEFLAEKGNNGATDSELRLALGISTNSELAGTTAGLHKAAKRLGFPLPAALVRGRRQVGAERVYWYALTPAMMRCMTAPLNTAE